MTGSIDTRLTGGTQNIIRDAQNDFGTAGDIRWGVNETVQGILQDNGFTAGQSADGAIAPVVPQPVMDRALCHVKAGDRSEMNSLFHTMEQVSEELGASDDLGQQGGGLRVAQANQAFAQAMATRWEQIDSGAVACPAH